VHITLFSSKPYDRDSFLAASDIGNRNRVQP
jgi:hypothetical protein